MSDVKDKMTAVIQAQPDDASYDEIMRELAFTCMLDRGLDDARAGRVTTHEAIKRRGKTYGH